jgi:metal-sulfur cluster biosynthetic enzyme
MQGVITYTFKFVPIFLAGERLVQQHNQAAFYCPRTGVQEVIVDQRVDSVPPQEVVEVKFTLEQAMKAQRGVGV